MYANYFWRTGTLWKYTVNASLFVNTELDPSNVGHPGEYFVSPNVDAAVFFQLSKIPIKNIPESTEAGQSDFLYVIFSK